VLLVLLFISFDALVHAERCVYRVQTMSGINVRPCPSQDVSCRPKFAAALNDTVYIISAEVVNDGNYLWRNIEYIGSAQPNFTGTIGWMVEKQLNPQEFWMIYV
jgi:hypothetical protein